MPAPKLLRSLIAALAAFSALPTAATAMGVTPLQVELQAAGGASRGTITVLNSAHQPMPVDVTIKRMTQDENGVRKYHDDGQNEFLILPPQAMIPAGGSQVFQVKWVGEPDLAKSKNYMFFANQVPVKLPTTSTGVSMVASMGAMVNVAPAKGVANLKVISTGIETDKKTGKRQATLTVENPTNTHALLPRASLTLQAAGWEQKYAPDALLGTVGIGLVPPGQRRKFVLPAVVPPSVTQVQASLDYNPRK